VPWAKACRADLLYHWDCIGATLCVKNRRAYAGATVEYLHVRVVSDGTCYIVGGSTVLLMRSFCRTSHSWKRVASPLHAGSVFLSTCVFDRTMWIVCKEQWLSYRRAAIQSSDDTVPIAGEWHAFPLASMLCTHPVHALTQHYDLRAALGMMRQIVSLTDTRMLFVAEQADDSPARYYLLVDATSTKDGKRDVQIQATGIDALSAYQTCFPHGHVDDVPNVDVFASQNIEYMRDCVKYRYDVERQRLFAVTATFRANTRRFVWALDLSGNILANAPKWHTFGPRLPATAKPSLVSLWGILH
jgi:hypothetical protein